MNDMTLEPTPRRRPVWPAVVTLAVLALVVGGLIYALKPTEPQGAAVLHQPDIGAYCTYGTTHAYIYPEGTTYVVTIDGKQVPFRNNDVPYPWAGNVAHTITLTIDSPDDIGEGTLTATSTPCVEQETTVPTTPETTTTVAETTTTVADATTTTTTTVAATTTTVVPEVVSENPPVHVETPPETIVPTVVAPVPVVTSGGLPSTQ